MLAVKDKGKRRKEGGTSMFARTSTWSGSPEALQKWADNAVSTVKGFVEGLPGNAGVVFLIDRDGGTALTLTLWDSDDAAKATDQFAEQSRAATVAATGTELVATGQLRGCGPQLELKETAGGQKRCSPVRPPTISSPRWRPPAGPGWTPTRCGPRSCRGCARPCRSTRCGGHPRTRPRCCSPGPTARNCRKHSGPYFVENEFLHQDVNKWTDLARDPAGVRTLMQATGGHPARSDRYRDIFAPLGLQDELRAVLRVRDTCWGYICLHREAPQRVLAGRGAVCAAPRPAPRRGPADGPAPPGLRLDE